MLVGVTTHEGREGRRIECRRKCINCCTKIIMYRFFLKRWRFFFLNSGNNMQYRREGLSRRKIETQREQLLHTKTRNDTNIVHNSYTAIKLHNTNYAIHVQSILFYLDGNVCVWVCQ